MRTRTYIAGDWDSDYDVVEVLKKWNDSKHWGLHFTDAHELTQARDTSLNCNIKRSLKSRMSNSKRFVLIIGAHTNRVTAGSCQFCSFYRSMGNKCIKGYTASSKSYIKYECDMAVSAGIKIIVLYKNTRVARNNCPSTIANIGIHIPLYCYDSNGDLVCNYNEIKKAFDETNSLYK